MSSAVELDRETEIQPQHQLEGEGEGLEPASKKIKTGEAEQELSPEEQYSAELKAKEAATGLSAVLVGRVEYDEDEEEDEDREPTLEQLRAIPVVFVPKQVVEEIETLDKYVARITLGGELEDEDDFNGFQMTNTASSYTYMDKIDQQFRVIASHKRAKKLNAVFGTLLATTYVFSRRDIWYIDTDIPEQAVRLLKGFATRWKDVLKHTDAELGINAESRAAVIKMLDSFAQEIKDSPLELKIKFHSEKKRN
jgi:hypothetical protein